MNSEQLGPLVKRYRVLWTELVGGLPERRERAGFKGNAAAEVWGAHHVKGRPWRVQPYMTRLEERT